MVTDSQTTPDRRALYNPLELTIELYDRLLRGVNGPGPDAEGATFYSEHYYNPRTREGSAPGSVGRWFERLATQQQSAKAAAWGVTFSPIYRFPFISTECTATKRRAITGEGLALRILLFRPR